MLKAVDITVTVAVYNVKEYISQCIESIIAQTVKPAEILLIDDGSTDGSGDICDVYSKKADNIRVIHQENLGLSDARNVAINEAKCKYILFVDGDDWIDPYHVESFAKIIDDFGDADYVHFRLQRYYNNGTTENDKIYFDNLWMAGKSGKEVFSLGIRKDGRVLLGVKGLFRVAFLRENKLYNVSRLFSEDVEFMPRVFYLAKKVLGNSYPGYCFRAGRRNSLSNSLNLTKAEMVLGTLESWDKWIYSACKDVPEDREFFECLSVNLGDRFISLIYRFSKGIEFRELMDFINCVCNHRYLKSHIISIGFKRRIVKAALEHKGTTALLICVTRIYAIIRDFLSI